MKVDHFYTIGSTHQECQDYATSKIFSNGVAFACVADGCSGSHARCRSVDIGARMLALSSQHILNTITDDVDHEGKPVKFIYDTFMGGKEAVLGNTIIECAIETSKPFFPSGILCNESFDSTLLMVIADEKNAAIFCFGDGAFVVEYKDGTKSFREFSFSSGAPYYLSYRVEKSRMNA